MDGLELMKAFREVALRKSFSRAALQLGISKATVSKYVAALEERSGVRLLNRSTRSLSLTDAGEFLLARSAEIVEIADRTLSELERFGTKPQGRLRVSAPHGLIGGWLSELLSQFVLCHPDVYLSLVFRNDVTNPIEDGIDIRISAGLLKDENLIVRRLAPYSMVLCASPRYWATHGLPQKPEDLRRHSLLSLSPNLTTELVFQFEGISHQVSLASRMEANDALALIELAVRGVGPTYVPTPLAQHYVERGMLVPVFNDSLLGDHWLFAAYSHRRHNSAAMRAMLAFLEQQASSALV